MCGCSHESVRPRALTASPPIAWRRKDQGRALGEARRTSATDPRFELLKALVGSDFAPGWMDTGGSLGNQSVSKLLLGAQKLRKPTCSCGGTCHRCSEQHGKYPPVRKATCSCGGKCSACRHEESELGKAPPGHEEEESGNQLLHHSEPFTAARAEASSGGNKVVHQGAATVVCDGAGDYKVDLGSWAGRKCGIEDCVRLHEQTHIRDLRARYPDGCKNADGTPKPAGTPHPTTGADYGTFRNQTECNANTAEIPCYQKLLETATPDCEKEINPVLRQTERDKKKYCGGC